jgi:tRNA pseudouridine38-40 synthase
MRNIKLTIEYDGSRYAGWQRLGKGEADNTIENKLLEILRKMTEENTELYCGCRTEAGVHAYGQVVNFKTENEMKLYEIKNYFNRYLPMDIAVISVEEVPERFHASLNVKTQTYLYRIAIGDVPSVFERKYTYYCFKKPDVELMKITAEQILGSHDFKNFTTAKKNKSTVRTIQSIDIYQDSKEIQITIKANDFLHNMARLLVGTLLEIGLGQRKPEELKELLNPGSEQTAAAPASAQGLFLQEIEY